MDNNIYSFKVTNRIAYIVVLLCALGLAVASAVLTHYYFTPDEPLRFRRYLAIPFLISAIVLSFVVKVIRKRIDINTEFELTGSGDMIYYKIDNNRKLRKKIFHEKYTNLTSYFFYQAPANYLIVFYFIGSSKPVEILLSASPANEQEFLRLQDDFTKISPNLFEEPFTYKGHYVSLQKLA